MMVSVMPALLSAAVLLLVPGILGGEGGACGANDNNFEPLKDCEKTSAGGTGLSDDHYIPFLVDYIPIFVTVYDSLSNSPNKSYQTIMAKGGILIGAMRKLQETTDFWFTSHENPTYGPYLDSINGVAGKKSEHTYWQLLNQTGGTAVIAKFGIGSYIPKKNEHILFKFTKFD